MNIQEIILLAVASLPSLSSVIGCITSFIKSRNVVNSLKAEMDALKTEVLNTKEYQDVKRQLALAHQENVELKKKINELLTKIDKVVRKDEEQN